MKIKSMFFAVSIILSLVSCDSNGKKQQNSPPEIGKIDPKTYSTSKDVWLADTKASCGDREITSNPNLTYGIDLLENFYWEVNKDTNNESVCYTRHLYSIAVTNVASQNSNYFMSIPTYQLKGILVPQLMRIKCVIPKTNTFISDTGDIEDKSEEQRIIRVHAFKSYMILIFEKAPTCIDGQLVLSLTKR